MFHDVFTSDNEEPTNQDYNQHLILRVSENNIYEVYCKEENKWKPMRGSTKAIYDLSDNGVKTLVHEPSRTSS